MKSNCLCVICFEANYVWVEFLNEFKHYDIYIIIDDNEMDYYEYMFSDYTNVKLVRIQDEECFKNGFKNMSITINKEVTAWEKAIYYFSTLNTKYDNIWFIEDDVFFYNEKTITDIDDKYKDDDLLTSNYSENTLGRKDNWNWKLINIEFPPPYYSAMCCCTRMSKNMLSKVKEYVNEYKTLFFLEALFPTLCKKHNLKYGTPDELKNIVYIKKYSDNEIDKTNIFHPVKDMIKHVHYRTIL